MLSRLVCCIACLALVAEGVCSVKRPSGAACILPTVFMAFPSRMRTHKQATPSKAVKGQDVSAHTLDILNNNSVERVRRDSTLLGLNTSRLTFVVGYFNDSLPALIAAEP